MQEEKVLQEPMEYSEDFFVNMLLMVIRDEAFAKRYLSLLRESFFRHAGTYSTQKWVVDIVTVLQDGYRLYGRVPATYHQFFDQAKDSMVNNNHLSFDDHDSMSYKVAQQLYAGNLTPDTYGIAERLERYIEREWLKRSLLDVYSDIVKGNHDIASLTDKLKKPPFPTDKNPLVDFLKLKLIKDNNTIELCKFRMNVMSHLGNRTKGMQPGLYFIGADTHVGKTNYMVNILMDLLRSNEKSKVLWFSLDDNKNIIINRVLSYITDLEITEVQHYQALESNKKKMAEAYSEIINYSDAGRLWIYDIGDCSTMDQIDRLIRQHYSEDIVVGIDGLYNAEIDNPKGSIREVNVARANHIKKLVDVLNIPLLTTGELRKKAQRKDKQEEHSTGRPSIDDIMETSKLAYNASFVMMLTKQPIQNSNSYGVSAWIEKNKISGICGNIHHIVRNRTVRMQEELNGEG